MAVDLYPAQLDGFPLEIENLDDSFERAVVRHEIPGRDGAMLEDMGEKARLVNIRCYFWDEGEHLTYASHIDLINHLKSVAASELIHPQYGSMTGMVERLSVRTEDPDIAVVDITFVEEGRADLAAIEYEDVAAAVEEEFLAGEEEQLAELEADLAAELGTFFVAAGRSARELVATVEGHIAVLDAAVAAVTNPVNSLVAAIAYGTDLPSRVMASITHAVERASLLVSSTATAPAQLVMGIENELLKLQQAILAAAPANSAPTLTATAIISRHLTIASSRRLALETATAYRSDEEQRRQLRTAEGVPSFDINGRYLASPIQVTVMTADELETTLATVRTSLQTSVSLARNLASLKAMARSLLDHVNTVKLERDRLITVSLENRLPLHLVCHLSGLPYNSAERVIAINSRIVNPNFTGGEVLLYGR